MPVARGHSGANALARSIRALTASTALSPNSLATVDDAMGLVLDSGLRIAAGAYLLAVHVEPDDVVVVQWINKNSPVVTDNITNPGGGGATLRSDPTLGGMAKAIDTASICPPEWFAAAFREGVKLFIAQAWTPYDTAPSFNCEVNLTRAREAGMAIAAYLVGTGHVADALTNIGADNLAELKFLAMDVEFGQTAAISDMNDIEAAGVEAWIYTSEGEWFANMGLSTAFSGYKLWDARWSEPLTPQHWPNSVSPSGYEFVPYGGWTQRWGWQWRGEIDGVPQFFYSIRVDFNTFGGGDVEHTRTTVTDCGADPNATDLYTPVRATSDLLRVTDPFTKSMESYVPSSLSALSAPYNYGALSQVRTDIKADAEAMLAAVHTATTVQVVNRSAYRTCAQQDTLWSDRNVYPTDAEADRWSARPGHSEHQLGLVMDVTSITVNNELRQDFGGTTEGKWLAENCHLHGFALSYPAGADAEARTGYAYEPWHFRYIGVDEATAFHEENLRDGIMLNEWLKEKDDPTALGVGLGAWPIALPHTMQYDHETFATGSDYAVPALTFGTANAAGSALTGIRSNASLAIFDATTPATQAIGDAGTVGVAAFAARRDHKHPMPAFATNAIVLSTAAAAGSAATLIRSDATIAAFDATVPSTQAFGDAAATGSAAFAARRDHKHAMMANPVAYASPAFAFGTANTAGAATSIVRSDAGIALFDATSPIAEAFGDTASAGSAAFAARRDHRHAMPADPVPTHAALTATHGVAGAIVGTTDTQTVSNKAISATGTTIPAIIAPNTLNDSASVNTGGTGTELTILTQTLTAPPVAGQIQLDAKAIGVGATAADQYVFRLKLAGVNLDDYIYTCAVTGERTPPIVLIGQAAIAASAGIVVTITVQRIAGAGTLTFTTTGTRNKLRWMITPGAGTTA